MDTDNPIQNAPTQSFNILPGAGAVATNFNSLIPPTIPTMTNVPKFNQTNVTRPKYYLNDQNTLNSLYGRDPPVPWNSNQFVALHDVLNQTQIQEINPNARFQNKTLHPDYQSRPRLQQPTIPFIPGTQPITLPNIPGTQPITPPNIPPQSPLISPNIPTQTPLISPNIPPQPPLISPNIIVRPQLITPIMNQSSLILPQIGKPQTINPVPNPIISSPQISTIQVNTIARPGGINVPMPSISMPNISMPNISMPNVPMPNVPMPNVSVANVSGPNIPSVSRPQIAVPQSPFGLNVAVPQQSLGLNVAVPQSPLGLNVAVPQSPLGLNVVVPQSPLGLNVPSVARPQIAVPQSSLGLNVPSVARPQIATPQPLGGSGMPNIARPKVTTPQPSMGSNVPTPKYPASPSQGLVNVRGTSLLPTIPDFMRNQRSVPVSSNFMAPISTQKITMPTFTTIVNPVVDTSKPQVVTPVIHQTDAFNRPPAPGSPEAIIAVLNRIDPARLIKGKTNKYNNGYKYQEYREFFQDLGLSSSSKDKDELIDEIMRLRKEYGFT